jgi:hypothetical protein
VRPTHVTKYQLTLILPSYYVLRADMLEYFITEIEERLPQIHNGWQVSKIKLNPLTVIHYPSYRKSKHPLHCIMSVQEAVDLEKSPQLRRLFSPQIFGRLPSTGRSRIRRTALGVVGLSSFLNCVSHYVQLYISQAPTPHGFRSNPCTLRPQTLQMNQIYFLLFFLLLLSALSDPALCQSAATALKKLCDANRKELAVHISAFGELHSSLNSIPVGDAFVILMISKIPASRIRRRARCFNQLRVLFRPCQ